MIISLMFSKDLSQNINVSILLKTHCPTIFISGITPGPLGTGRLMEYISILPGYKIIYTVSYKKSKYIVINLFRRLIDNLFVPFKITLYTLAGYTQVCFIHPQTLGFNFFLKMVKFTAKLKLKNYLFLVDSSFFCVRSYNHINQQYSPCFKCIGGKVEQADINNCLPFPNNSIRNNTKYIKQLRELVNNERVRLIFQNFEQKKLAQKQFSSINDSPVIGLWTSEFEEIESCIKNKSYTSNTISSEFDVVYHGTEHSAKGFYWALELAQSTPHIKYLFPVDILAVPPKFRNNSNCTFKKMNWLDGLITIIKQTKITLVPSLWSACIEGALIKSIMYGNTVCVVQADHSYSTELDSSLVYKLDSKFDMAKDQLSTLLTCSPLNENDKHDWFLKFTQLSKYNFAEVFGSNSQLKP